MTKTFHLYHISHDSSKCQTRVKVNIFSHRCIGRKRSRDCSFADSSSRTVGLSLIYLSLWRQNICIPYESQSLSSFSRVYSIYEAIWCLEHWAEIGDSKRSQESSIFSILIEQSYSTSSCPFQCAHVTVGRNTKTETKR